MNKSVFALALQSSFYRLNHGLVRRKREIREHFIGLGFQTLPGEIRLLCLTILVFFYVLGLFGVFWCIYL